MLSPWPQRNMPSMASARKTTPPVVVPDQRAAAPAPSGMWRLIELEPPESKDFDDARLEWRRLFSEFLRTFFIVLAGAGGAGVRGASGGGGGPATAGYTPPPPRAGHPPFLWPHHRSAPSPPVHPCLCRRRGL